MSAEHYIKSQCPSCDEFIEFPEQGLGETIDCPHCKEQIVLKRTSPLNYEKPIQGQMNVNQKILTGVALLAFIVSVCNASWEVTSFNYEGKIQDKIVMYSPIWQQPGPLPYSILMDSRHECHLFWPPLIGIWISIGVIFTGSFFLLKNTSSILEIITKKR